MEATRSARLRAISVAVALGAAGVLTALALTYEPTCEALCPSGVLVLRQVCLHTAFEPCEGTWVDQARVEGAFERAKAKSCPCVLERVRNRERCSFCGPGAPNEAR